MAHIYDLRPHKQPGASPTPAILHTDVGDYFFDKTLHLLLDEVTCEAEGDQGFVRHSLHLGAPNERLITLLCHLELMEAQSHRETVFRDFVKVGLGAEEGEIGGLKAVLFYYHTGRET